MKTMRAIVLLLIFCFCGTAVQAEKFTCKSDRGFSAYRQVESKQHDHSRYAPQERELFQEFASFVSSFDGDDDDNGDGVADFLANPVWVAYELRGLEPAQERYREPDISIDRPNKWYKHRKLSFLWIDRPGVRKRRVDESYSGIGTIWNRGHLAMADHAQRYGFANSKEAPGNSNKFKTRTRQSWQASCNTHVFFNAVPQAANMNQGPWLHLENYVAALSNLHGKVWTVAGPIFREEQAILYIGDPGEIPVAVPHALFKILFIENQGTLESRAFIFEQPSRFDRRRKIVVPKRAANKSWVKCGQVKKQGHVYDHRARLTTIAEVEAETGLTFLANNSDRDQLISQSHNFLWPVAEKYWSGAICGGQDFVIQPAS